MPEEASSSSRSAMSANTSASASSAAASGPGRARYSESTPTRMAPLCRGSANTARALAATAADTNPGHREATESRSWISMGDSNLNSSTHGLSPMVTCKSSSLALTSSEANTRSRAVGPLATVTLAPSAPSLRTAARHTAAIGSGASSPAAAVIHAHTLTARSPIT